MDFGHYLRVYYRKSEMSKKTIQNSLLTNPVIILFIRSLVAVTAFFIIAQYNELKELRNEMKEIVIVERVLMEKILNIERKLLKEDSNHVYRKN